MNDLLKLHCWKQSWQRLCLKRYRFNLMQCRLQSDSQQVPAEQRHRWKRARDYKSTGSSQENERGVFGSIFHKEIDFLSCFKLRIIDKFILLSFQVRQSPFWRPQKHLFGVFAQSLNQCLASKSQLKLAPAIFATEWLWNLAALKYKFVADSWPKTAEKPKYLRTVLLFSFFLTLSCVRRQFECLG